VKEFCYTSGNHASIGIIFVPHRKLQKLCKLWWDCPKEGLKTCSYWKNQLSTWTLTNFKFRQENRLPKLGRGYLSRVNDEPRFSFILKYCKPNFKGGKGGIFVISPGWHLTSLRHSIECTIHLIRTWDTVIPTRTKVWCWENSIKSSQLAPASNENKGYFHY